LRVVIGLLCHSCRWPWVASYGQAPRTVMSGDDQSPSVCDRRTHHFNSMAASRKRAIWSRPKVRAVFGLGVSMILSGSVGGHRRSGRSRRRIEVTQIAALPCQHLRNLFATAPWCRTKCPSSRGSTDSCKQLANASALAHQIRAGIASALIG